MRYTIQTLENLFSDYVSKFEGKADIVSKYSYLSEYSLKCYHLRNKNNNRIYRYTICHGSFCLNETKEMTLRQMITAIKTALETNKPLIEIWG